MSMHDQCPPGCAKPLQITFALSEKKNDWSCPRCGDLQFQKNTQCRLCGCPRPQGLLGDAAAAGAAAGAGVSTVSEGGDWTCGKCCDLQFKKNVVCRLCGTPAPGATGLVPGAN